jgi:predicted nuclease of predicted toxin-antitoxin system
MRLLLDESVPGRLRRSLKEHSVRTVVEVGWSGIKNGKLLALAAAEFDAFVTVDKLSIEFLVKLAVRAGLPISISVGRGAPIAKLGSRLAERHSGVGLRSDLPELRGQAVRPAELKR